MPEVSLLLVTMERFDLTARCVPKTLRQAGCPFELLACDNGSKDLRVPNFLREQAPAYLRTNAENEGYAPMLNQMLLRAAGDWFCVIDPDFEVKPNGWLAKLLAANKAIPESGISGAHCVEELYAKQNMYGFEVHPGSEVFGVKFFSRAFLERVGAFCEDYAPYGVEDADICFRATGSGLVNYYLAGLSAIHHGNDVGENTPYRKHKWDCMARVGPIWFRNRDRYRATDNYYVPLPEMR